ncbi:GntR family transcriptional regulator [Marinobacterium nitratireducens]|uniref:GntR family transcriptional regulator n=1 Tax=Marinobacterium nitratireducens TaxID=518897 RepID=A0A917ZRB9_9GAMM|nr:GntR family transcriptional regulator [Marinobacterium nitratireducens]GGO88060.1 GntR family transcriptional regulator [Marinobacterium nitratireducens]
MKQKAPLKLTLEGLDPNLTVNQRVYRSLRNALMCGAIAPGRALTIRELAGLLDVSPMPVREALRQLAAENALEILGNRRVQVPRMSAMKFRELYEARIALESHAAERALPYIDQARIDELRRIDAEIDAAYFEGDHDRVSICNQRFHRCLYEANPHQVTVPLIESLWLQLGPFMRLATSQLDEHYQVDRHNEALDAIRSQDAFALRRAIAADIRDGNAFVVDSGLLDEVMDDSPKVGARSAGD